MILTVVFPWTALHIDDICSGLADLSGIQYKVVMNQDKYLECLNAILYLIMYHI